MLKMPGKDGLFGIIIYDKLKKLEFSSNGKTLSAESKEGEILAWDLITGEQKPGLDTVYLSAKLNYVIETAQKDKTTKIDIYLID